MKRLLLLPLLLLLMAPQCEPAPPPGPDPESYCSGAENIANYVQGGFNTIIGGELSTDRRATVQIYLGQSYCTGTIIGPRTVLTAAHCGYGDTTTHTIRVEGVGNFPSTRKLVHPDYWKWVNENNYDPGRRSDIMLLYTDVDLPGPYVSKIYNSTATMQCSRLKAHGYGKDEFPDEGAVLRESNYLVKTEYEKHLVTKQASWGGSCFGDSGSALYAEMADGSLQVAGVLSTTATSDCLYSASYVKTDYFKSWIVSNTDPA